MDMAKLAKLAGVSTATISRAFHSPHMVRPKIREKILKLAKEHNYVYNAAAGDLSRKTSNLIGVLIPTSNKSVFGETLAAIQEKAQDIHCSTIIGSTFYDKKREQKLLQQLQERRVAGIILTGFTFGQEKSVADMIKKNIACVVIWEKLEDQDFSYVGFDNFKAAYSAVDYLISLRHRRIGLLVGPYEKVGRVKKRFMGYKKALEDHNIPFDSSLVVSSEPDLMEGKQAMHQLLSISNPPTAVFAASDRLAIGGLTAIKEKGLKVPQNISLVGFDDVEFAAFCDPPLTTVRVPAKEIGQLAVKLISEAIEKGNYQVKKYCLNTELIIRNSCKEVA
jgi:DNA-binding LacI/PurR family transcriptional regulator